MTTADRPAPPARRSVSANCRDHSGPCISCGCSCHDIPAPPNLREMAGLPPKPEPEEDR